MPGRPYRFGPAVDVGFLDVQYVRVLYIYIWIGMCISLCIYTEVFTCTYVLMFIYVYMYTYYYLYARCSRGCIFVVVEVLGRVGVQDSIFPKP